MYGVESWGIGKAMWKRIEAAEMRFWRRILKMSWTKRMRNVQGVGQWDFLRHVIREGGIESVLLITEGWKKQSGQKEQSSTNY